MRVVPRLGRFVPVLVLLMFVAACATAPWRKATVTGYETAGVVIAHVKETADHLLSVDAITAAEHAKIITVYELAKSTYVTAGNILTAASATTDSIKRDTLLEDYGKRLTEYHALAYEVYRLIMEFQKN